MPVLPPHQVEKAAYAGVPPTKTCINCHAQIWTNAQLLEPVRHSWATGESINWIRVHDLPDYVYFNPRDPRKQGHRVRQLPTAAWTKCR